MTKLESSTIRPYAIEKHPINTQKYLLPTDPISITWEFLDKALRRRSGGFVIWGYLRTGKSSAITYLKLMAALKYKGLFPLLIDGETNTYASERAFFSTLCSGLAISAAGTAGACRKRAIDQMIKLGQLNIKRLFLLFMDEPQKWTDLQMNWLCEIYDKLQEQNVRLVTVLVGQVELSAFRDNYIERGDGVKIDRLMQEAIQFCGVTNLDSLRFILRGYDTLADNDPEWPFTRFFFPQAFAAGFRMEPLAQMIWDVFMEVIDACTKPVDKWIPMQHLTVLVETLFLEYYDLDAPDFKVETPMLQVLLREVRFAIYVEVLANSAHPQRRH